MLADERSSSWLIGAGQLAAAMMSDSTLANEEAEFTVQRPEIYR